MCESLYYTEDVTLVHTIHRDEVEDVPSHQLSESGVVDHDVAYESLRRIVVAATETVTDLPSLRAAVCEWVEMVPWVRSPHRVVPNKDGVVVHFSTYTTDGVMECNSYHVTCDMRHQGKLIAKYEEGYS